VRSCASLLASGTIGGGPVPVYVAHIPWSLEPSFFSGKQGVFFLGSPFLSTNTNGKIVILKSPAPFFVRIPCGIRTRSFGSVVKAPPRIITDLLYERMQSYPQPGILLQIPTALVCNFLCTDAVFCWPEAVPLPSWSRLLPLPPYPSIPSKHCFFSPPDISPQTFPARDPFRRSHLMELPPTSLKQPRLSFFVIRQHGRMIWLFPLVFFPFPHPVVVVSIRFPTRPDPPFFLRKFFPVFLDNVRMSWLFLPLTIIPFSLLPSQTSFFNRLSA